MNQFPVEKPLEEERILDKRVIKKKRDNKYYEYLVKWRNHLVEDSTWVTVAKLQKRGSSVEDLMDRSP